MYAVRQDDRLAALSRLCVRSEFSLANYLRSAVPWRAAGAESLAEAIALAAADLRCAARLGRLIIQRRGMIASRIFPSDFAALNDLHIHYVAACVLDEVELIARKCQERLRELAGDAEMSDVVQRIRDKKRRHRFLLMNELTPRRIEHRPAQARRQRGSSNGHLATLRSWPGIARPLARTARTDRAQDAAAHRERGAPGSLSGSSR